MIDLLKSVQLVAMEFNQFKKALMKRHTIQFTPDNKQRKVIWFYGLYGLAWRDASFLDKKDALRKSFGEKIFPYNCDKYPEMRKRRCLSHWWGKGAASLSTIFHQFSQTNILLPSFCLLKALLLMLKEMRFL